MNLMVEFQIRFPIAAVEYYNIEVQHCIVSSVINLERSETAMLTLPSHPASLAASNLGAPGGGFGFGGYTGSTKITVPSDSKAPAGADVELAAVILSDALSK